MKWKICWLLKTGKFGSLPFVHTKQDKLIYRAIKCAFIVYPMWVKGYKWGELIKVYLNVSYLEIWYLMKEKWLWWTKVTNKVAFQTTTLKVFNLRWSKLMNKLIFFFKTTLMKGQNLMLQKNQFCQNTTW